MSSDLDKVFELIEEGNELEKRSDFWEAADRFGRAMMLLHQLAESSPSHTKEQEKIVELYRTKSHEYRHTARESLIQALQQENEQDSKNETTIVSNMSMRQAEARIKTFSLLFSKAIEDMEEKTSSLEERLMELNASLPSGFKTSKERMADINRGLRRLGLSLYSNSNHGSSTDIGPPQSEEDPVAQIIAQAKDEVQYNKPATDADGKNESQVSVDTSVDVDTSDSEDSEDSVSLDDLIDEPVLKNRKAIRHKVLKAQVKLAELVALLNVEPDIKFSDDVDEKVSKNDDDKDKLAAFDLDYGKATLSAARNYLNKALKEWPEDS